MDETKRLGIKWWQNKLNVISKNNTDYTPFLFFGLVFILKFNDLYVGVEVDLLFPVLLNYVPKRIPPAPHFNIFPTHKGHFSVPHGVDMILIRNIVFENGPPNSVRDFSQFFLFSCSIHVLLLKLLIKKFLFFWLFQIEHSCCRPYCS